MVPSGWKLKTLSNITKEKVSYGIVQAGPHVSNGVPYLKSADVGGEIDIDSLQKTAPEIHYKYRRSAVHPGDIVFSLRGNIGRMSIVPNELIEANLTQGTARISVDENNDSKYIYYQVASTPVLNRINALSKGSTFKEISLEELRKVKVACAPLHEQQKIAKILSTWDNAITTTEKLIANSKQQKKALMQQLLTGKKRLVNPETGKAFEGEWEEITLRQLGKCITGLTYSPNDVVDKGTLVLRSSNIQDGKLSFLDNVYVSSQIKEEAVSRVGDILICVRNGSRSLIGKSAYITEKAAGQTHGAFMTSFRGKNPEFVFQLFQTPMFYRQVNMNLGATINSINTSDLHKFKFTIPKNADEISKIAKTLATADKEIELLEEKLAHFKQEKKALMQQLLTGKRRVNIAA
ncbi:restriction endonuclease subunit S [Vibrio owensii]|uniref:restriction endonuclease subunit S n=1 Tax=Vibrio owensii TaxID=696485 RepID=UPI0005EEC430|nr:restriction endonuclease subunit S [Vibrio owensii]